MATYTYPGVYIQEISSGVHTITGVATSIAAFVGWATQGPTDEAALVQSWSDYQRLYGGLAAGSYLGYAVNDFFNNGGSQAYIIRLVASDAQKASVNVPDASSPSGTAFVVTAQNEGGWAGNYGVRIVQNPADSTRYSFLVVYTPPGGSESVVESFANLSSNSADPQFRYVQSVVNSGSSFVEISGVTVGSPQPNPISGSLAAYVLQKGADGAVLSPATGTGSGAFEAALNANGSAGNGGVRFLDRVDLFNLLCVPGEVNPTIIGELQHYCVTKRAFYVVDSDPTVPLANLIAIGPGGIVGADAINSALYYPWVRAPDALQQGRLDDFPPCGFVAGIFAATDAARGVWKAPAGVDASLTGVSALDTVLTDLENGSLNVQAINCLRTFRNYGTVVWGARTLRGNDQVGSEWKYVPVRRLALYLEESLYRGTQWAVFELNDTPLWAQIRLNVNSFMQTLFRRGAFQGASAREAYFVKCDSETTTQNDINMGVVNVVVGFAPLQPAEFVVIQIQQLAGQLQA
jgi:phage tail sheath protein FI